MRKHSHLVEGHPIGNAKVTSLYRDSRGNYTFKHDRNEEDPVEVGKTVLVKGVNTTIQRKQFKETDV